MNTPLPDTQMLERLVTEFETMTHSVGPISTSFWLRDYCEYAHNADSFDMFGMGGGLWDASTPTPVDNASSTPINLEYLADFFDDPRYHHYASDVRWTRDR
jgi:hypothetical protein